MNDSSWPIFVRLWTNGDPGSVDGGLLTAQQTRRSLKPMVAPAARTAFCHAESQLVGSSWARVIASSASCSPTSFWNM
jgi:hypothetical protein